MFSINISDPIPEKEPESNGRSRQTTTTHPPSTTTTTSVTMNENERIGKKNLFYIEKMYTNCLYFKIYNSIKSGI